MAKIKYKTGNDNKKIGKKIIAYWKGTITQEQLKTDLQGMLDKADTKDKDGYETNRKVEVDFVFDEELDSTTRLVWITIPAPDPRNTETVSDFVKRYYDDQADKDAVEEALGMAALFGCGR